MYVVLRCLLENENLYESWEPQEMCEVDLLDFDVDETRLLRRD